MMYCCSYCAKASADKKVIEEHIRTCGVHAKVAAREIDRDIISFPDGDYEHWKTEDGILFGRVRLKSRGSWIPCQHNEKTGKGIDVPWNLYLMPPVLLRAGCLKLICRHVLVEGKTVMVEEITFDHNTVTVRFSNKTSMVVDESFMKIVTMEDGSPITSESLD